MPVPLLDLTRQYQPLREEFRQVLDSVCDSQRFILGPEVDAFEREAAEALDVPHAVGVSSGTDALLEALMALGVGVGDEVIMPTFTFFATAGVVARLGARPVFVDVDPVDFCIEPQQIAEKIGARTKAVIPVHLFGQSADMKAVMEASGDVPVLEDCAQAWGADFDGRQVGSIGVMGAFSFFPSKNLGCFGDGGLITTADPELGAALRELRMHGQSGPYQHPVVGGNFRIDALQAAILRVKLPHVSGWIEGRRANARRYEPLFDGAGFGGYRHDSPRPSRAAAIPSINMWFESRGGTSCVPSSVSGESARPSTILSPCICNPVLRTSDIARAISRFPRKRVARCWPCRSFPSSPRTSRRKW